MKLKIKKKRAKKISYGGLRLKKGIKYIVIHYTGNKGDTAENNARFFATLNTKKAGAHFFVGKKGVIYKSIPMNRTAWAVGGIYNLQGGAGAYYGICTNQNSVSIELCDCCEKTSQKQKDATRELVKYIQKHCPNAKNIIRHWDVNGKNCPAPMVGEKNKMWNVFKSFISN